MGCKKLLLTFIVLFSVCYSFAQVTTSAVTGLVKDAKGEGLIGATVKAIHVPTGTVYGTTTQEGGRYTIPNMRVGGPYTITITYVGYQEQNIKDLYLSLGTALTQNVKLEDGSKSLNEVTITGQKSSIISSNRTGTQTNISQRQLTELPTVGRSIQDFARLTPQAVATYSSSNGSPLGISFAGQSNKFNSFTVDGANANDAFGLTATGTNGGQANVNAVPLESVQEVQIVLSPYDITQSNFTGGGINAVTKSGTNQFHGSAYFLNQNQSFVGENVQSKTKYPTYNNTTWGASLGGPIIKNKLFFFVNAERNDTKTPLGYNPADAGSGSKFSTARLDSIRTYVKDTYGFDPGSYTDINSESYATSVFARIDWNISEKHKLTFRHSYVDGSLYNISRSATTMTFANSGYYMLSTTNSTVAELNSSFNATTSNVLRVTYNRIRDRRSTVEFPSVYITEGGLNYNLGADYSSPRNSLNQDNFTIVDNLTIQKKKHTITVGTDNQFFNTSNVFLQYYYGYYTYRNLNTFLNNSAAPTTYAVGYSNKGGNDLAPGKIRAGQFSLYGQDIWDINDRFRLTYGLRIDLPVFFNKPDANTGFNASDIATTYGIKNNTIPKTRLMWAPRVAFNWDVNGDGTTQLRGGAGLFTGRVPLVWISNAYSKTGVAFTSFSGTPPSTVRFNYDPADTHLGAYIPTTAAAPTEIDVTDKNFKYPQVLRGNLAIDQKLPWWGLIGTIEALYTKTLNNILYKNLNVGPQTGQVTLGNTTRPWYNFARANSSYTDVIYLTNTSKGYSYNLTAQIQKPMDHGWSGSLAYTYGASYSMNDGTSSTAYSSWRFAYNVNGMNNLSLARANFDPGHRVVANASKTFRYAKGHLSTTIGLVYQGYTGQRYSVMFNNNITGDDASGKTGTNSLAYLPTDASQFSTLTLSDGTVVTPAQQLADFQAFAANNKYLSSHMGQNTERNGLRMPWESHFDLKLAQDFILKNTHRIEVGFDILNVANLLNRNWGWSYYLSNQSVSLFTVTSQSTTPTYTFNKNLMNNINGTLRPYTVNDYLSRWRGQLSVRYNF
ncbi:carboxypeptidase regulatory-like domain-containing protein [Chitinophaga sancti]|uniref:TonB-dependent receptor n=1 Tax=Chitinophaga sancti TaxID=1004 RepID=UPI002A74BEA9|nr:carboxypeptidase regulatory-like domain-containing protein [Chitinophaga sancti]WPQ66126.1 carboxypeptidase regulatory-like domain-containing protein [Chitinophaga sancti]